MAKVHDVAAYIISKLRSVDSMKLQKLLYYSQAWSLVWDGRALFGSRIEAWANGPVVRDVFKTYQGQYKISAALQGDKAALKPVEQETVNAVLDFYGKRDGFFLSELTHRERPWMDARRGIAPGEKSDNEITHAAMRDYYGGLV